MKKYTKLICMIAAVCLLGAAAFCGFRTYANSYGTISERIIQPLKVLYKSQSNFWLSFQKFLYAGIAYCYRLFRHFLLWKIFSNLLISPYVLVFKSSMWSSKFSVYYLCNQPLHFCYRRFGSRMRVIVQRHIDVGMSHDVLQCLWVHSCIC